MDFGLPGGIRLSTTSGDSEVRLVSVGLVAQCCSIESSPDRPEAFVPALEKGVVDCGITGTMPAYKAKWHEVTNTLFRLPVGFTASVWVVSLRTWNQLSPATQEILKTEMAKLSDKSWKTVEEETEEGVACTTGNGKCTQGTPGKLKLVKPSDADLAARDKVLNDVVLAAWASRCGPECAQKWTDTIGKQYGLVAKAK